MCSIKSFRLNSLSLWKMSMLKTLALYMLLTVINYLMMLSALFEVKFSAVSEVILDDFVWMKGILFIKKIKTKFDVIVVQQYICWQ